MATYAVTTSDDDDWGEAGNRFKTRGPADVRFDELRILHPVVRIVRWENDQPVEVARHPPNE